MTNRTLKVVQVAAPLRRQVVETLRTEIVSGRLKPGDRLIERELCEMLGVSRTAVREALRQLETEELVDNLPNRGPQVAVIARQDAIGIYEVRGALEALVGGLFAERATDPQRQQLGRTVKALKGAYAAGDVPRILKLKDEFYDTLLEGAGNATADTMLRLIHARANVLRSLSLSQADRWLQSSAEIADIYAKIVARDVPAVEAACRNHVRRAAEAALRVL